MSLMVWSGFYLIGFIGFYNEKKTILISSLAALPQALYALDIVPKAWMPDRVFNIKIGIEDFIFCFLVGGLVWMSILWFIRKNLSNNINLLSLIKRLLICYLFGINAFLILFYFGIDGYLNPFIVMILWSIYLINLTKHYWKIALLSMFIFILIWFLIMSLIIYIWPDIPALWSWDQLMGISFLRYPIEEFIWALLYGASWSITIAYVLDVQLKPSH